jgi:SWI/SNF-related matrix-associated actin-dependent regulator 1 of chromatin subfamily A
MLSVRGKMAQIVEWIQDFLENENKLIVFATHHETVDVIMEKFKTVAVKLDGRDSAAKKQISIDGFQKNPEIKLFVGNIIAAGSAINLSAASTSVFVELDWVPGNHDQAEDRPIDITKPAVPINAYYLVGVDTVEEKIAKLLDEKRKVLEAVLDGKEPEDSALLTMLIQKYKEG